MLTPPVWWFIAGVGLVILEILAPAFILVFFGLAAILVSLLTWILPTMPPWVPWIEFACFSLAFPPVNFSPLLVVRLLSHGGHFVWLVALGFLRPDLWVIDVLWGRDNGTGSEDVLP